MKNKKQLKRLVSMLLVGCMLTSLLPSLSVFAATADSTETWVEKFSEDFDGATTAKLEKVSPSGESENASVQVVEFGDAGNKVLELVDTNAPASNGEYARALIRIAEEGQELSGKIAISYDMYIIKDQDSTKNGLSFVCGSVASAGDWASASDYQLLRLKATNAGKFQHISNGNTGSNTSTGYTYGEWFTIRVELDTDEDVGTYTTYVKDATGKETELETGTLGYDPSKKAAGKPVDKIDNIGFFSDSNGVTHTYVDNIKVAVKEIKGDSGEEPDEPEGPFDDPLVASGASFKKEYNVEGQGNQVLTFTVTPGATDNTLKSGIKIYAGSNEVLRFKMDTGYFRLSDLRTNESSSVVYERLAAFEADTAYTLKLVIVPAAGDDPAVVTLYQISGEEQVQLGETYTVTTSDVGEITKLTFFTDSGNSATATYTGIKFESNVDLSGEEPGEEPVETEKPEGAVYFQNFADLSEGDIFYKQPATDTENLSTKVTTFEGSKVLEFLDKDEDSGYSRAIFAIADGEGLSGEVTISYKLYDNSNSLDTTASQGLSFVCGSEANTGYKTNDSKYQLVRVKTTAGKIQHKGGNGSNATVNGAYTQGTWVPIKVVLNTVEGTYTVYVNDVEKAAGDLSYLASGSAADKPLDKIDNIGFMSDSGGVTHTYIDDITVTVKKVGDPGTDPVDPPVTTDPTDPSGDWAEVYSQNFEGDVKFQGTPTGTQVIAEPEDAGGNHVMEISDTDTDGYTAILPFDAQSGRVAVSFKIKVLDTANTLYVGLGSNTQSGSWASGSNGRSLRLTFTGNQLQFWGGHVDSNGTEKNNTYTTPTDWIPVKVVLDTKAGKFYVYSGETYDVYLGQADLGYSTTAAARVTDFGDVDNIGFATNTTKTAHVYIDDLVVTAEDAVIVGNGGTEYWSAGDLTDETFTTTTDQIIAKLPVSGVTMAVGAAPWTVSLNNGTGKVISLGGVDYTKHLNADSGNAPKVNVGTGEYFKFAIPADIDAGELVFALRVNSTKTLVVLEDGQPMTSWEGFEPPVSNTDTAISLSVVGGKTYTVYVESSMPYFYGFSFRPVDMEGDIATFQAEIDKLGFDWIRGENTDPGAVDKDLNLTNFYTSPNFGGADVNWTSNSVAVSGDGKVNRLAEDTPVTLTAHISVQQISYLALDKTFQVTVKALTDDAEAVAAAKAALSLGAISAVKKDLELPSEGMHGTTITWVSSDPAVLTVDASSGLGVIHPNDSTAQTVTLTATITRGSVTETKEFVVTVAAAKILDLNSWAYATAEGGARFAPVDGGKLRSINVTNNNQHLDTDDYKFKVEILAPDGTVKSASQEWTASTFFTHGVGVSENVGLDLAMDSGDSFRLTAYDDAKTYVTITHSAADDVMTAGAKIYVIGDSTAAPYDNSKYPQTGWAQVLEGFFDGVEVVDLAIPGRSSLDYKTRPQFETLKTSIQPGDYLIIQFGHNDSHNADSSIYTSPDLDRFADGEVPSYKKHMAEYVTLAWDAGAYPIIATSISRRKLNDTDGVRYGNAAKALAAELSIPCVDVFAATNGWVNHVGLEESIDMFNIIKPEDSRFYYDAAYAQSGIRASGNNATEASWDNTHVNYYGARLIAMFAADGIQALGIPVGTKRNGVVVSTTLPHYADATSATDAPPAVLPEELTVTAQEAGSATKEYPVAGAGSHVLTFTVTPSADASLSGGVRFLTGVGSNKSEALRLEMDGGSFKLVVPSSSAAAYRAIATYAAGETEYPLGSYTPGTQYTFKVVITPKISDDQPAQVEVYQVSGATETQMGETCAIGAANVKEITRLDFFADTDTTGSFVYSGIDYQNEILPELEYAPFAGDSSSGGEGGGDGDGEFSGNFPDSLTVTAEADKTVNNNFAVSGTGNQVLTFTVTPSATTGLGGGVKFYTDDSGKKVEILRFKLDLGTYKVSEVVGGSTSYASLGSYEAGQSYTLKVILVPKAGDQTAFVKVYQISGDGQTQLGKTYTVSNVDLSNITQVNFFADSKREGSFTYTGISFQSKATLSEEESTPPDGSDPTPPPPPPPSDGLPSELTVTAGESSVNIDYPVTSGAGNVAMSFTVTPSATTGLGGGVKFYNGSTELARFKLDNGVFKVAEVPVGDEKVAYTSLGAYAAGTSYAVQVIFVPGGESGETRMYVCVDGQQVGSIALTRTDPQAINKVRFFADSNGAGSLAYQGITYASGVDFNGQATSSNTQYLLKNAAAWTLSENGSASIVDEKLIIQAGANSSSNRIDVSGEGIKTLSFTVAVDVDNPKDLKGGVNFRDADGNTVLRFKMQNGGYRLSDLQTDANGNVVYKGISGHFSTQDSFRIQLVLYPATDTKPAYVKAYKDGQLIGDNYTPAGTTLESITRLYFFTDSNSSGKYTYSDMVWKTGPMTPAQTGAIDFVADGWKLQLPVENPSKAGSILERTPAELADGYADDYFYADVDASGDYAVVFHTPVEGFKTANAKYTRSELREMLKPSDKTKNWGWEGTHILTTEQRVTHVPASGQVITSQIHGIEKNGDNANPLVKVRYAYDAGAGTGSVVVELKETTASDSGDIKYTFPNVALGQKYKTVIQARNGEASVTISTVENGVERSKTYSYNFVGGDEGWKDTLYYFKVGNYIQDNTDTGPDAYADVWVYSASVQHPTASSGGGVGGGGGGGTQYSDGGTTVTETRSDGTVVTIHTAANGDTMRIQQNPNGTVQITVTSQNGNGDVTVDAGGKTQASVSVSEGAAQKAQQAGEILTLPLPKLTPGKDLDSAPVVKITKNATGALAVKLPVDRPASGTVLVAVRADGTQEIVKMSVPTQDGMVFQITGDVTLKLVNNAQKFTDVASDYWAADAVDFASGRELLVGTGANTFAPNDITTRAALVTILARLDGVNTAGGETWYSKGMNWAVAQGVSDGTNPDAPISREQFVTMLYRYGGQPAGSGNILSGYADSAAVSDWAVQAMEWALGAGILRGKTGNTLDPAGTATRAEAATLLMRYCMWVLGVPLDTAAAGAEMEETVAVDRSFDDEAQDKLLSVGTRVVELDGKRVVEINDTSAYKTTSVTFPFEPMSGIITISFKMYIDPRDSNSVLVMTAGSRSETGRYSSNSAGEFLRLRTVSSSKKFQFRGGDSTKTSSVSGGSYRCGEWIDLKVVMDTDSGTFSAYANGELLGEKQPMSCKSIGSVSRMRNIDNVTFMTEKASLGRVYIDDVKVTGRQREYAVWNERVADYMTVASSSGLLSGKWQLKQGEIVGGTLIVSAGEDSASNKVAVSGTGNQELFFTVVSDDETGAKGGVRFMSSGKEVMRFKLDGGKFKITDMRTDDAGKVPYATLGAYNADEAYEVSVLILRKTETRPACVKVYVDGQQLGGTYTLTDEAAAALNNVTELNFFTDKAAAGTLTYSDLVYRADIDVAEDEPAPGQGGSAPANTPAGIGVIDFVKDGWKIQLPVENPSKAGSVLEKSPQELANGYTDQFFYAAEDENGTPAVVFHSPVEGFKTGNTHYARSELRELIDASDSTVNWTWQGTHRLVTEERVTHVPASGQTITSQIHGIEQNGDNANPLVKVRYVYDAKTETGRVVVELKNTTSPTSYDYKYSFPNVALGQKFGTEILVVDGVAYVTINTTDPDGTQRAETYSHDFVSADPYWKETWYYFKLGNYIQDDTDTSEGAYADVWVYSSDITHSDTVDKIPVDRIVMDQTDGVFIRSGERTGLSVSASPIKAYDKSVIWAVTEGGDVAVVDKDGYVTGVKEGVAVVTATSVSNPAATATCTVTVRDDAVVEVKPIFARDFGSDAAQTAPAGYSGADVEITTSIPAGTDVSVVNEGGNNLVTLRDTSSADPAKLSFVFAPQTDTTTIAFKVRIDALGEHTVGAGDFGRMYIVAAGSDSWYGDDTELFRIRNNAKGTLGNFSGLTYVLTNHYDEITTNADKVIGNLGDWVDVVYIVTPNNGTAKANTTDVYMNGYPVAMAVANRNTVDYVNRLDVQTGSADQLTLSVDDVKVYTGIVLPDNAALVRPTSLALVRVPSVMAVSDWAQASVEVTPADGYEKVSYSVVSGDAVTISEDGYVTAARPGVAEIRAESVLDSAVYAQQTITVEPTIIRPTALSVPTIVHVSPGDSEQMQVTVLPADATDKGVKYEIVSGSEVATVNSQGVVTGKAVGTASVRVTSLSDPTVYETVPVSVTQTLQPGQVVYADDFDAGQLDSAHWTTSLAKENTYVEMADGAMTFIDANTAANPKVTLDFTPVSGKVSIQFRIKVLGEVTIQGGTVKSTGYRNLRAAFGSGNIATTANESFCIRSNGTYFTYNVSGSTYVEMPGNYDVSEWNEVTLVTTINIDGADTTDVYVNGAKVLSGAANKVDYPAIDKLCFSADTSNVAAYVVDDLAIWAGGYSDKPADMSMNVGADTDVSTGTFSDVPAGYWAEEAIRFASDRGLLGGTGNGVFAPGDITTRATLVTILARLDGVDTTGGDTWYSKGNDWAVAQGISDGTSPDAPISREQFVTMLYRYAGQPETDGQALGGFADGASVSAWAAPAVEWAVANGLMTGRADGTLDPAGTTTRAEAAALLMRYCQWSEAEG